MSDSLLCVFHFVLCVAYHSVLLLWLFLFCYRSFFNVQRALFTNVTYLSLSLSSPFFHSCFLIFSWFFFIWFSKLNVFYYFSSLIHTSYSYSFFLTDHRKEHEDRMQMPRRVRFVFHFRSVASSHISGTIPRPSKALTLVALLLPWFHIFIHTDIYTVH